MNQNALCFLQFIVYYSSKLDTSQVQNIVAQKPQCWHCQNVTAVWDPNLSRVVSDKQSNVVCVQIQMLDDILD